MKNFPAGSDAGTSNAFIASPEIEALVPREMIPLVAACRWAELLAITEARVASPGATATDWHAHGTALLGLRRFAEGGAALDYAKQ